MTTYTLLHPARLSALLALGGGCGSVGIIETPAPDPAMVAAAAGQPGPGTLNAEAVGWAMNAACVANVRDFGASGSPHGDDTRAVLKSLEVLRDCPTSLLHFPPGYYNVSATLELHSGLTIQGTTAMMAGACQLRFTHPGGFDATGMALLAIPEGTTDVTLRDLELRSLTPGPDCWPRPCGASVDEQAKDRDRIANEHTSGIRFLGFGGNETHRVRLDNLRIANFTFGVEARGAGLLGDGAAVRNLVAHAVALEGNYIGVAVDSLNVTVWEVQNLNVVEMHAGQHGVRLERTGDMRFLETSCASTNHDAEECFDVGIHGRLELRAAHAEGTQRALRLRDDEGRSTGPVVLHNCALAAGMWVEGRHTIHSLGNAYALRQVVDSRGYTVARRALFTGPGTEAEVARCADVFLDPTDPNPGHPVLDDTLDGLVKQPVPCAGPATPFGFLFDTAPLAPPQRVAGEVDVVRDFGAKGDGRADDSESFAMALAAVPRGGTIWVPHGSYRITKTLDIGPGVQLQGEAAVFGDAARLVLDAVDVPLLRIVVREGVDLAIRSVVVRDLELELAPDVKRRSFSSGVELLGDRGTSTDYLFARLSIRGFATGIRLRPSSDDRAREPMVDSLAIRQVRLAANDVGLWIQSNNASNWNVQDVDILEMSAGQVGVRIDGSGSMFRGLRCEGRDAGPCVIMNEHNLLDLAELSASGCATALHIGGNAGCFPSPVHVRDSDLSAGVLVEGRAFLTSLGNLYPEAGAVFDHDPAAHPLCALFPGEDSHVYSCGDTVADVDTANGLFRGLRDPTSQLRTCP